MTKDLFDGLGRTWRSHLTALRGSVRVLVVDDEPMVHEVVAEILADAGWQVEVAESAESAWERIQAGNFDLLVTDKNLPGMSGVDLIGRVQAAGLKLPSLVITGYASVESISHALAAGAVDYLSKPFEDVTHLQRRAAAIVERGLYTRLYQRVVDDLVARLRGRGAHRERVRRLGQELFAHKAVLGSRPDLLLVAPAGRETEVLAAELRRAELNLTLAHTREDGLLALADGTGPLTAVVSLRLRLPAALIAELCHADPLLQVVATTSSPRLDDALAAVAAGASDYFIQAVESPAALVARVRRALETSRRDRLYLQLIAVLHREAAEFGHPLAAELAELLPEAQRAFLLRALTGPGLEELPEIEVDLTGLFEDPLESTTREQRRHARVDARDVEVWFRPRGASADFRRGWLRDLSRGGFFLRVSPPPERETALEAHLLPRGDAPGSAARVAGRVVRVERHDPDPERLSGCGVLVSEQDQAALDPLLARLGPEGE
jgi:CheY-like chemotaxis protein